MNNNSTLDVMQLWVESLLKTKQLNSELRHRLLWDVVYKRNNGAIN